MFFIDTEKSSSLKLKQICGDNEFAFEVEASNDDPDCTVLKIRGPDHDGLLAGITAALSLRGISILDLSAHRLDDNLIEDTFRVVDQNTRERLEDKALEEISELLIKASGEGPLALKVQINELEERNDKLQERIKHLEAVLIKRRMTLRPSK